MPYRQDSRFPLCRYYIVFYASRQEIFIILQNNFEYGQLKINSSFNFALILSIAGAEREIPYKKSSECLGV